MEPCYLWDPSNTTIAQGLLLACGSEITEYSTQARKKGTHQSCKVKRAKQMTPYSGENADHPHPPQTLYRSRTEALTLSTQDPSHKKEVDLEVRLALGSGLHPLGGFG